jgi:Domain of unknown function (DUF4157)/Putative RNase-like toxin, toxin_1
MSSVAMAHDVKSMDAPKGRSNTLRVSEPGDAYEREADQAASEVISGMGRAAAWSLSRLTMHAPLQRECTCGGECDDCKKENKLQREANGNAAPAVAPAVVHAVLRAPGRQMEPGTRSFMESRFGYDFSRVRIFNDSTAASSARAVSANAYTVGDKIVFNAGKYSPESSSGRRLLAHELAHVVQQQAGSRLLQRDDIPEIELAEEDPRTKSRSVLQQAFDAADAKHWEDAARLANGLSPSEMKVFLSQYRDPELMSYLHKGALGAKDVGGQSAIAQATEATYKAQKQKEETRYKRQVAKDNGTAPPTEDGSVPPPPKPLTVAEKKKRCESGQTKGLMVFPLRMPRGMWRISVAPISATRSGKDIIVHQPVNAVLGDPMFKREVKTLPLNTFLGGVHLAPDDIVRVRVYDDNERLICVTGEQMLKLSAATDTAIMLSILGTALDAVSVMAPGVSQGLSKGASLALGGATILANEGVEVARQSSAVSYGLKDKIDWAQIGFETLLQAVTLGFGSRLTDAAVKRIAGVAVGAYTRPALQLAVEGVLQGAIAVVQSAARALFNRLRGQDKKMTVEDFLEELAREFAQGVLFHLVMSTVSHEGPTAHVEPEGGIQKPSAEHSAPSKKGATAHDGAPAHEGQQQGGAHEQSAPQKPELDAGETPSAVRKEDAVAKAEVEATPNGEHHEVIATKKGLGRCSDSPCPVIYVAYAQELKQNPKLKQRYEEIEKMRTSNPEQATKDAAALMHDLEGIRQAAASHAQAVKKELMPQLAEAEAELNPARQATIDYQAKRKAAGESLKGGSSKAIWNAKERIWILKRQMAHPERTMLEQARVVGIKNPDGTIQPTTSVAATGRTPDFVEVRGTEVVAGDLKSQNEFIKSIQGGVKKPKKIEGDFRSGSKVGGQHTVEQNVLKVAAKNGGVIVLEGRNVVTGKIETIEVPAANYKSEVLTYEDVVPN